MRIRQFCPVRRSLYWMISGFVGLLALLLGPAPAVAQEPLQDGQSEPILRVEEDWLLILNEPNNAMDSPQFHTTMSPGLDLSSFYAQVTWNYRWSWTFAAGGLQLHSWKGDVELSKKTVKLEALSTTAETITWTQALETDGVTLYFDIMNGNSTTWGVFGKDMRISSTANLPDLNAYSPDVSARNSLITYGLNRADIMMILEVRYYGGSGLIAEDDNPRIIYLAESN